MPVEVISDPEEQRRILKMIFSNQSGVRRNKYGAKLVRVDGLVFSSKGEYERWKILKLLERNGNISNLRRQVRYPFFHGDVKIETYVADFVYNQNGETVVEDAKGYVTKDYRRKRKLMLLHYGIKILETATKKRKPRWH